MKDIPSPEILADPPSEPEIALPEAQESILVLDFGGQTAQLIARRVRDQHTFCQLVRHDLSASRIRELAPKGLILSGSPASVYGREAPHPDPEIFNLGIPILGICYGMQVSCSSQGSNVSPGEFREFGRTTCRVTSSSELFEGVPETLTVWMSHGDQVQDLSDHFTVARPHRYVRFRGRQTSQQTHLWDPISSGSDPHGIRRKAAGELCAEHLRLSRTVADELVHRAGNCRGSANGRVGKENA